MKRMNWILGITIVVLVMVFNITFTSHAYTEEQKAQAKAWLSAHGYSPDMGGANQAYQDYLNGKFDEELGVDVNGDGIPATTQTTENSTEEDTEEYADADVGEEDSTELDEDEQNEMTDVTDEESADKEPSTDTDTATEAGADAVEEAATQDAAGEVDEKDAENQKAENDAAEAEKEESTLFLTEKWEEYQEGLLVIVLSVVLMLLAGLFIKGRK